MIVNPDFIGACVYRGVEARLYAFPGRKRARIEWSCNSDTFDRSPGGTWRWAYRATYGNVSGTPTSALPDGAAEILKEML